MHVRSAVLSIALLLAAGSAQAGSSELAFRGVTGVGPWIAEQGNAALRALKEELKQRLPQELRPQLPLPEVTPAAGRAPPVLVPRQLLT